MMLRFHGTSYAGQVGYPVPEGLGFLPSFLSESDPRPAREQIDENYAHGGGFSPFNGFELVRDSMNYAGDPPAIKYPGDPALEPLAYAYLRNELLTFYEGEWLAIIQPDGSFQVTRMD